MKTNYIFLFVTFFSFTLSVMGQDQIIIPDLSEVTEIPEWVTLNRRVSFDSAVVLNAQPGNGILYNKEFRFANGKIELDIMGKDVQGSSFVGIAFHGINDSTYDAVYFRPFNFKNPQRRNHSVQYISMPQNDWYKLRTEYPGIYENEVTPVPDPDTWFHATIIVQYPEIKVFVNDSDQPSLSVHKLNENREGWAGFWVGNNSEGSFKNVKVTIARQQP